VFSQSANILALGERLRASAELQHLPTSVLRILRYRNVYTDGDFDDNVYFVQSGQIKISTCSPEAKNCLLGIYATGDIFGESCLVAQCRTETATAMKDSVLKRIRSVDLLRVLTHNGLIEAFISHLVGRIAAHEQTISNLVTCEAESRLAAILLQLGRQLGRLNHRNRHIEDTVTQQELAEMVGTTRSRIGQFLKRFHALGLIERAPRAFLVINEERLTAYLETSVHGYPKTTPKKLPQFAHY
jgi:CRP/FNR family transcriptional regulator, cyclic AMP receptor protein